MYRGTRQLLSKQHKHIAQDQFPRFYSAKRDCTEHFTRDPPTSPLEWSIHLSLSAVLP